MDANRDNDMAIAELRARVDGHDEAIARHENRLTRIDETIVMLRECFASVSTKDDIAELRKDIGDKFDKRLTDAHNSIPAKFAAVCAGGMFLLAAITLALNMAHHG